MVSTNLDGRPVISRFLRCGCFAFIMDLVTIGLRLSFRLELSLGTWWRMCFSISVSVNLVRMTWNGIRCALDNFLTFVVVLCGVVSILIGEVSTLVGWIEGIVPLSLSVVPVSFCFFWGIFGTLPDILSCGIVMPVSSAFIR